MYVIVTGGCGYIGSHIVLELLLNDYQVIVIDDLSNSSKTTLDKISKFTKKELIFYQVDIKNKNDLEPIFQDFSNDILGVIHVAGVKSVTESIEDPKKYYRNNVVGSINILDLMKKFNVNNIVFSSSATVYGIPQEMPISESHQIAPLHPYGNSKATVENLLFESKYTKSVILRYFNPVGNHHSGIIGEEPIGVPANLFPYITKVITKKPGYDHVNIYGDTYSTIDGTGVRDYIHVCDLVSAHIRALELLQKEKQESCQVFNIGTEHGYSVLQVIKKMQKVFNTDILYEIKDKRTGDVGTVIADCLKAKKVLGWTATRSLNDMCVDLYKYHLGQ